MSITRYGWTRTSARHVILPLPGDGPGDGRRHDRPRATLETRSPRRRHIGLLDRPELNALVTATNMAIAMSAWMRYRGHSWAATAEMAAAMYLPFIVLFIPLWLDLISATGLVVLGHVLMLAGMAAVTLLRPGEYAGHHA